MSSAHYLSQGNIVTDSPINAKDRHFPHSAAPRLSQGSNRSLPPVNLTRVISQERGEKYMICYLLRLESLHLERIAMLENKLRYRTRSEHNVIMSEKHREAAMRTATLEDRLHELLRQYAAKYCQQEEQCSAADLTQTSAVYLLSSLAHADSSHAEVERQLIDKIFLPALKKNINENENHSICCISLFLRALIDWIRLHHTVRYRILFSPLSLRVATMRLTHLVEDRWEDNKQRYLGEIQRQSKESLQSRKERKTRTTILRERLSRAQRNAFEVRKRIFLVYELLQGYSDFPKNQQFDPVKCAEVLHLIRQDLADGEIHSLLQLTADDSVALEKIVR